MVIFFATKMIVRTGYLFINLLHIFILFMYDLDCERIFKNRICFYEYFILLCVTNIRLFC